MYRLLERNSIVIPLCILCVIGMGIGLARLTSCKPDEPRTWTVGGEEYEVNQKTGFLEKVVHSDTLSQDWEPPCQKFTVTYTIRYDEVTLSGAAEQEKRVRVLFPDASSITVDVKAWDEANDVMEIHPVEWDSVYIGPQDPYRNFWPYNEGMPGFSSFSSDNFQVR